MRVVGDGSGATPRTLTALSRFGEWLAATQAAQAHRPGEEWNLLPHPGGPPHAVERVLRDWTEADLPTWRALRAPDSCRLGFVVAPRTDGMPHVPRGYTVGVGSEAGILPRLARASDVGLCHLAREGNLTLATFRDLVVAVLRRSSLDGRIMPVKRAHRDDLWASAREIIDASGDPLCDKPAEIVPSEEASRQFDAILRAILATSTALDRDDLEVTVLSRDDVVGGYSAGRVVIEDRHHDQVTGSTEDEELLGALTRHPGIVKVGWKNTTGPAWEGRLSYWEPLPTGWPCRMGDRPASATLRARWLAERRATALPTLVRWARAWDDGGRLAELVAAR